MIFVFIRDSKIKRTKTILIFSTYFVVISSRTKSFCSIYTLKLRRKKKF